MSKTRITKCPTCDQPVHIERWRCTDYQNRRCMSIDGRAAKWCFKGWHSARVHDEGGIECPGASFFGGGE